MISLIFLFSSKIYAQAPDWKYFRASNTGVAGDYHHVIEIDRFNNKWTAGYLPFWSDGSLVRYDDTVWTCWSNFEGYLPNDRVNAIAFDTLDRIWAGTDEGIAMYDGTEWFQFTSANTPMPVDQISGLAVDAENNIWATYGSVIYIEGGIAKYDGVEWTLYNTDNSGLPTTDVFDIGFDSEQNLWIGSNVGLIKFDGLNWITYNIANSEISSNNVMSLCVDDQDRVWVGSNSVVDVFDGGDWTQYNTANSPIDPGADIFDIAASGNKFLFGTSVPAGPNAMVINDGGEWEYVATQNWPISVAIDSIGNFWSAGIGYVGIYDGIELINYTRYNTGLAENFNNDVFIDSKNRKWFANGNGGIQMFDCPIWEAYGPWNEGLFPIPQDYTTIGTATTEDPFGDIWISYDGTYGTVVQIPNGDVHDPDAWTVWELDNTGINIQFATHLESDSSGNIFVGLDGGGLSVFWRDTETWENFNYDNSDLVTGYISDLAAGKEDGVVWIANYVLQKFDNGVFTTIDHDDMGISPDETVLSVAIDSFDNIWIGTTVGLLKYDGVDFIHWDESNSNIVANPVFDIEVGRGDTIYLSAFNVYTWPYYGGFSIFDGEEFISFNDETSPLAHKQTEDIELDHDGNLWLLTQSEGFTVYRDGGVVGFECIDMSLDISQDTSTTDTTQTDIVSFSGPFNISIYPNPFVVSTTIQFEMPATEHVEITMTDMAGKPIRNIVNKTLSRGIYNIQLNREELAPGIYFCTVSTENKYQTIKIIIQ